MGKLAIIALRVVIVLSLLGFLVVQTVIVPLLWIDLEGAPDWFRISFVAIVVVGILTLEVCAVCVWRLLTMVKRGSVFSAGAFRFVDIIIGSVAAGAVLTFLLAVILAPGEMAPGIVGIICGAALVIGGVALVVYVLRMLLAQAVDRDAAARSLQAELDEVV